MLTNGHGQGHQGEVEFSCVHWTTSTAASTDYATNGKLTSTGSFTSYAISGTEILKDSRPLLRFRIF